MECKICKSDIKDKVYEDEICFANLGTGVIGHIEIHPKKHAGKLEDLNSEEINHLFTVANVSATVIFEGLGAQGTNILCNTKQDHLTIDVVPRNFSDDMDFQWPPKQIPEDELQQIASRIKDKTFMIGKEKPKEETAEVKKESKKIESEWYKQQLRRMP